MYTFALAVVRVTLISPPAEFARVLYVKGSETNLSFSPFTNAYTAYSVSASSSSIDTVYVALRYSEGIDAPAASMIASEGADASAPCVKSFTEVTFFVMTLYSTVELVTSTSSNLM